MRHRAGLLVPARSPPLGPSDMIDTSVVALLIPLAGVALSLAAGDECTPIGAVALTPIAVAANQDLDATTRAKEESGSFIPHAHPRQAKGVLDGIVRRCNTAAAPVIDTV